MKFFAALFALAALVALVAADNTLASRDADVCYRCAMSYIDCFRLFGFTGCTDRNAEHYTWCRECTGSDPAW
ncbi:hypothetical protein MCUN1_003368 [Malassezia cuniculi]|uniref:Uncharacterized protein n=1 Tax=Malassezia cuniculi TaxID=948313 RepID=A0AAF0F1F8_9BASI|nr:hypothetical protein MCUN1_003368 [Malassezia cuniculi]